MSLSNRIREEKLAYHIVLDYAITENVNITKNMNLGDLTGASLDIRAFDVFNTNSPLTNVAGHNEGRFKISHPKMSTTKSIPIIYTNGPLNGDRFNLKICPAYPHEKSLNDSKASKHDKMFAYKLANILTKLLRNIICLQYEGGYLKLPDDYAKDVLTWELDDCVGLGILDVLFPETPSISISRNLKTVDGTSVVDIIQKSHGNIEIELSGSVPYGLTNNCVSPITGTGKKLYVESINTRRNPIVLYGNVFDEYDAKAHYILTHPDSILNI